MGEMYTRLGDDQGDPRGPAGDEEEGRGRVRGGSGGGKKGGRKRGERRGRKRYKGRGTKGTNVGGGGDEIIGCKSSLRRNTIHIFITFLRLHYEHCERL